MDIDTQEFLALTRQIATEQAAREGLELRWRMIMETVPDAAILADHDGEIEFMNAAARRLFGDSPKAIVDLMPSCYRRSHLMAITEFDHQHESPYFGAPHMFHALRPDGSEFPVEFRVAAVRESDGAEWSFIAILRDVEELLKAKTLWSTVAESMAVGLILTDRELRLLSINRMMEEISGSEASSVIGRLCYEVWPHLVANGIVDLCKKVLSTGRTQQAAPNEYETPSGARGIARGTYKPWRIGEKIAGVACTVEARPLEQAGWFGLRAEGA